MSLGLMTGWPVMHKNTWDNVYTMYWQVATKQTGRHFSVIQLYLASGLQQGICREGKGSGLALTVCLDCLALAGSGRLKFRIPASSTVYTTFIF